MDIHYSAQENILMGILIPLIICTIIAILNVDWLNNLVIRIYNWIENRYYSSESRFWKAFWGILRFPKLVTSIVPHEGWKSGLTVGLGGFSVVILIGALYLIFWITIFIMFLLFAASAAGSSNQDNPRY